jgi:hypothetical protein
MPLRAPTLRTLTPTVLAVPAACRADGDVAGAAILSSLPPVERGLRVPPLARFVPTLAGCCRATVRVVAAATAATPLLASPPAAAAGLTLAPTAVRVALPGCDSPTPVRAPGGAIYSNVSDCSVGGSGRISTGWVRLEPSVQWVPSSLTTHGDGARGRKASGAVVEGGTVYLLERNLTSSGGMRLGWSANFGQPGPTWGWASWTIPDFGWGSFAQASPDGYEYVYLRDSRSAYGSADRVDLARVQKGRLADLSAWQIFAGSPSAPAWVPWANRAARKPILSDPSRINRPHVSRLGGCWTMAVTMPPRPGTRGGSGLAVYTSANPFGPWNRRYYATGVNLGESVQFSPLFPGTALLTHDDRFEWRRYSMSGGC